MARLPRLYAPRIPQLVEARFARPLAPADGPAPAAALDRFRGWLAAEIGRAAAGEPGAVALHCWAVMTDRITLLATPGDEAAMSRLNLAHGRRTGSGLVIPRAVTGRYRALHAESGRVVAPAQ